MNKAYKELADLYISSGSLRFGSFKLAAHDKDPNLPLTPYYLHYPNEDEEGSQLLPRMFEIIGQIFAEIIEKQNIKYHRIVGMPNGARSLAENTAKLRPDWPENLIEFEKIIDNKGRRAFSGPSKGRVSGGDVVLVCDDHTSGGYSKSLFIKTALKSDLNVRDVLTVVDRQQGAETYLRSKKVKLHSIFKIETLMKYYLQQGLLSTQKFDLVKNYITNNQIAET